MNNLKQIALALQIYHDDYKRFPPAYIADERGRPMHSWRVLILPYLDDMGPAEASLQNLKKQYRFDEPWDGPNNRQLHDTILPIFNCPSDVATLEARSSTSTNYVAVIGPETMWPGATPVKIDDVTDGASNTLHVVEVANSGIHWMEPRDLHVLQMAKTINSLAGQGISSRHKEGANTELVDGSRRFLSDNLPADIVRALLTRNGGETVGDY